MEFEENQGDHSRSFIYIADPMTRPPAPIHVNLSKSHFLDDVQLEATVFEDRTILGIRAARNLEFTFEYFIGAFNLFNVPPTLVTPGSFLFIQTNTGKKK